MRKTIAQLEKEAIEAEKELGRHLTAIKDRNNQISQKDQLISELEERLVKYTDNQVAESRSRVIQKTVLIEKLKDGFMVKEFTGESTTPQINRTHEVDLNTQVAGRYVTDAQDITVEAIGSTQNLLTECGAGAKYLVKIEVLIAR